MKAHSVERIPGLTFSRPPRRATPPCPSISTASFPSTSPAINRSHGLDGGRIRRAATLLSHLTSTHSTRATPWSTCPPESHLRQPAESSWHLLSARAL